MPGAGVPDQPNTFIMESPGLEVLHVADCDVRRIDSRKPQRSDADSWEYDCDGFKRYKGTFNLKFHPMGTCSGEFLKSLHRRSGTGREQPVRFHKQTIYISRQGLQDRRRMLGISCLLAGYVLVFCVASAEHFYHSGRRICSSSNQPGAVSVTQSFVQPVYKPLMVMCEGHRVCSTYRTTYKVSYRQVPKRTSLPLYTCCPGWTRSESRTQSCHQVSCPLLCQNGGTCSGFNTCQCPAGWSGSLCQRDVDECTSGNPPCAQRCVNTAGSFQCQCLEGFALAEDMKTCLEVEKPTQPTLTVHRPTNATGVTETLGEEMQELRNRIKVLEQKLQLVLTPLRSLTSLFTEVGTDPMTFLTHSLQQLDRIDSLSEQISFLEERLETCSCKNTL